MKIHSNVTPSRTVTPSPDLEATLLVALATLTFSLSLPATRAAVPELGSAFVGLGRAVVAGVLAIILLKARGEPVLPERRSWAGLVVTALGVVIGFPLLTSIALKSVPAIHGLVVVGILPAMTAIWSMRFTHERPPIAFWGAVALGVVAVLAFGVAQGAGHPQPADALLLGASVLGGLGYARGAQLSRDLQGWRVICYVLVLSLPVLVVPVALEVAHHVPSASWKAWLGFGYVSLFSQFLGFFALYRGLSLGNVARLSQIQLAQPLLGIAWSALLLGEHVEAIAVVAAVFVILSIALSRRFRGG